MATLRDRSRYDRPTPARSDLSKPTPHFTPELFAFLKRLKKNNDRDWFTKNKPQYEEHVKEPLLRFIDDLQPRMEKISPHIVVDVAPFMAYLAGALRLPF